MDYVRIGIKLHSQWFYYEKLGKLEYIQSSVYFKYVRIEICFNGVARSRILSRPLV